MNRITIDQPRQLLLLVLSATIAALFLAFAAPSADAHLGVHSKSAKPKMTQNAAVVERAPAKSRLVRETAPKRSLRHATSGITTHNSRYAGARCFAGQPKITSYPPGVIGKGTTADVETVAWTADLYEWTGYGWKLVDSTMPWAESLVTTWAGLGEWTANYSVFQSFVFRATLKQNVYYGVWETYQLPVTGGFSPDVIFHSQWSWFNNAYGLSFPKITC